MRKSTDLPPCTADTHTTYSYLSHYPHTVLLHPCHLLPLPDLLQVSGDPSATVSSWEGGQRSVAFRMPLNVPAMIKKLIGGPNPYPSWHLWDLVWRGTGCSHCGGSIGDFF